AQVRDAPPREGGAEGRRGGPPAGKCRAGRRRPVILVARGPAVFQCPIGHRRTGHHGSLIVAASSLYPRPAQSRQAETRHLFVTGGVASSLGKGLTASSLGRLLKLRGLRVVMQKLDPYLNVDPGTMNPFQ